MKDHFLYMFPSRQPMKSLAQHSEKGLHAVPDDNDNTRTSQMKYLADAQRLALRGEARRINDDWGGGAHQVLVPQVYLRAANVQVPGQGMQIFRHPLRLHHADGQCRQLQQPDRQHLLWKYGGGTGW